MKKRIALIYGGEGCEHDVSVASAKGLFSFIDKSLYDVLPIFIDRQGFWFIKWDFSAKEAIPTYPVRINRQCGFIFNNSVIEISAAIIAMHGDFGEDGRIQGALDTAHIRYIGCEVAPSAICSDKIYAKIIAEHLGIPCAEWMISDFSDSPDDVADRVEKAFGYPVFLKPPSLGSSIGIKKASNRRELLSALSHAAEHYRRVLIEKAVDVEYEIECGVFQNSDAPILSASGKVFTAGKFYDFDKKYNSTDALEISHGFAADEKLKSEIEEYAKRLAGLLALRHLSRIDFFVTKSKRIIFNEINTFPGMTKTSLYPRITEDMGFSEGQFINLLLSEATK